MNKLELMIECVKDRLQMAEEEVERQRGRVKSALSSSDSFIASNLCNMAGDLAVAIARRDELKDALWRMELILDQVKRGVK